MPRNTLLNVVIDQRGLRFGVINPEDQAEQFPDIIRICGLTGQDEILIETPRSAKYHYGSIYSPEISGWLHHNYPRTAADPIPLLKFTFSAEAVENGRMAHIYTFVGDSGYRRYPRRRLAITPDGDEIHCRNYTEIIERIYPHR